MEYCANVVRMASIHLQAGKPNWFCYFTTPDGVRRTRSTKTRNRKKALIICKAWDQRAKESRASSLTPDFTSAVNERRAVTTWSQETSPRFSVPLQNEGNLFSGKRKTLIDIAKIAKVSHVTVSLALRSHPRISKLTREKILAIAKRIGYRPDPVLSALNAYRREIKPYGNQETLAWINVWRPAHHLREIYGLYWKGAVERCEELGYKLEEFRLIDYGMRAAPLSQVLLARNIHGVFIPPQQRNRAHLKLAWDHFSAVAFGYTLARPRLHVVTNAQFRSAMIALRALRQIGHRRIGFVLERSVHERTDHNYVGGYLAEQLRLRVSERIPVFFIQDYSAAGGKKFAAWYHRHQPGAILTQNFHVEQWMTKMGYEPKRDYSLARLDAEEECQGGIDQNGHAIGRTAVDFLVGMLYRNEKGIPKIPLRTLVEGSWVDGKTIRRLIPSVN